MAFSPIDGIRVLAQWLRRGIPAPERSVAEKCSVHCCTERVSLLSDGADEALTGRS
jgi:hypothetical protein